MAHDDKLQEARAANIAETRRRFERILTSLYLITLVILFAWFDNLLEPTKLSSHIQALDRALTIDSLQAWDQYLYDVAPCFPAYYFDDQGPVVGPERLEKYIAAFEDENKRLAGMWSSRGLAGYRIDEMKGLLGSQEHWQNCEFWARQDSLVSFLFSIAHILDYYMMERLEGALTGKLAEFFDRYPDLNPYVDSALQQLRVDLDSVRTPFSYSVRVGWNPFLEGHSSNMNMWGRQKTFDDYTSFDLADRAAILHRLQIIGRFRKLYFLSRELLQRSSHVLTEIAKADGGLDSVTFSRESSSIKYVSLDSILQSEIWTTAALPETLSVPHLLNLRLEVENTYPRSQWAVFDAMFPEFVGATKRYKIDKVGGLRQMRELLKSEEQLVHRRVSAFGASVSYSALMIVLPALVLALYLLSFFVLRHLNRVLQLSRDDHVLGPETHLREISNSPSLMFLRPKVLALLLIVAPGLITVGVYVDQLGIIGPGNGSVALFQVLLVALALMTATCFVALSVRRIILICDGTHKARD